MLALVALIWGTCAEAAEPRVLLLRGLFGVFSTGMDSLADELRAKASTPKWPATCIGPRLWKISCGALCREGRAAHFGRALAGGNNVIISLARLSRTMSRSISS